MRNYEKKMVERDILQDIVCDRCHKSFTHQSVFDSTKTFEVNEFELRWRTGEHYPECGHGCEINVDLCSECRQWLHDLLVSHGIDLFEKEWDC